MTGNVNRRSFLKRAAGGLAGATTLPGSLAAFGADSKAEDRNAVFRFGYGFSLARLDPHLSNIGLDNTWLFPVYDRLIHNSPTGQPVPGLAESWKFSSDGLTLTLKLRTGVTFHDGFPFDADAVIANIERGKSLAGSGTAAALAIVKSIQKVDAYTVALNLTRPSASILLQLSDKYGAMISPPAIRAGNLANATAGAGMYKLESFRQGDKGVYVPYEKYWDKEAVKLKRLEIYDFANPTAAINALLSGQVDAATIAPGDVRAAQGAGFDIVKGQTLETWFIAFDHRKGDLKNPLVRQAMAYAIDKKAIISALFHGEAVETTQTFPKGYWAYAPKAVPENFAFNLNKAKQLMQQAGSRGFDLPCLHAPSDFYKPLVEALQSQLGKIDIKVTSDPRDGGAVAQAWLGGSGTGLLGPWSGRPDPYITDFLLYSKNSTFANVSKLEDPRIEEALAASELAGDFAKRTKLLQDVSQYASETQFHLSLWNPNQIIATRKNVKNMKIWVTSKPEFRGIYLTAR